MRWMVFLIGTLLAAGCVSPRVSYVAVENHAQLEQINQLGSTRKATLTLRDHERKFRVSYVHVDTATTEYRWKDLEGSVATANVSSIDFVLKEGRSIGVMLLGGGAGFVAGYLVGTQVVDDEEEQECNLGICLEFSRAVPGLTALLGAGVGVLVGSALGKTVGGEGERVVFHGFDNIAHPGEFRDRDVADSG